MALEGITKEGLRHTIGRYLNRMKRNEGVPSILETFLPKMERHTPSQRTEFTARFEDGANPQDAEQIIIFIRDWLTEAIWKTLLGQTITAEELVRTIAGF